MELTALTQEQQWGIAYLVQVQNEQIEQQNTNIAQQNKSIEETNKRLPRDTELQPLLPLLELQTVESFINSKVVEVANQGYTQLIAVKEQTVLEMIRKLPTEQKEVLIAQFQVPDIIKS